MGRNWAIAIGINSYDNLQSLSYAQRDAEAMRDYFFNEAGFEQVYYFAENAPDIQLPEGPPFKPLPTFARLNRFLDIRFREPFLQPGDNFWFFFAGHGKRHQNRDYLLPSDVNPSPLNIDKTAIAINYITERLRRCGADNVILILDACRNEGDRDGEGIGIETQQGVVTLFGCSPSERSYEIDALQQGAFTYALLQGLRIQGEGNCATVERLYAYLKHEVPELNRRYQKPCQTPYTIAEPATKLHLILLPKQATGADVTPLRNDAQDAEIKGDLELARQLWRRVLAIFGDDLQAIEAIERLAVKQHIDKKGVPPTQFGRRPFMELLGWIGGGGLGVAASGFIFQSSPSTPTPPPTPTPSPTPSPAPSPAPPPTPTASGIKLQSFDFPIITVNAKGEKAPEKQGKAGMFKENLGGGVELEMVGINGGSFQMGTPSSEAGSFDGERPQHPVILKPFLIGRYPVTQAQWKAMVALPKVNIDLEEPSNSKDANRPVERITWREAVEWCDRLSKYTLRTYRLPSEAEWEYACRAGTTTPFYFGETITTTLANYQGTDWTYEGTTYPGFYGVGPRGDYRETTTDVGSFPPNAFGLCDMHGNVWEWCLDRWHDTYKGAPSDGRNWINGGYEAYRSLRGGSWARLPHSCRSGCRSRLVPGYARSDVGFRVVCSSAWTS